jgi:hypothetical protein
MSARSSILTVILTFGALSAALPSGVSAGTVEYVVRFDATWSAATHPIDFPPNPHFSGLIGGTHNAQVTFWEEGELASPGIKNMAETGNKSPLDDEIQAAIDAGTAGVIISGNGTPSPGTVSRMFNIDEAFPLVTVVSMLAPSPDWFVGVSGISLREGGNWVPVKVVELVVYDAGTDSGTMYRSPNQPTIPPVPIFEKTDGPFAQNNVVGTFTFFQPAAVGVPEVRAPDRALLVSLGPNPLRGSSRFEIRVPGGTVGEMAVHSVGGRRVRALFRGQTANEPTVVVWDGRDSRGALVPAGVYFVTLQVGRAAQTEKIVVTR